MKFQLLLATLAFLSSTGVVHAEQSPKNAIVLLKDKSLEEMKNHSTTMLKSATASDLFGGGKWTEHISEQDLNWIQNQTF